MSFKTAISDVLIANEALAMLPEEPIVSLNEQSVNARECQRWYKPVVGEMLEKHHWGLATVRAPLAAIPNDRAGEWQFAYAKPDDMAYPVKMLGPTGIYSGWTWQDSVWSLWGRPMFLPVGDTIYSWVEMGVLEYTSFNITEANFTQLFKGVVRDELASRICMPITKNEQRTQALLAQAEVERQRVMANDLNRSQPRYGDTPTESEMARFGVTGASCLWGGGYALDPVAQPANTGY